MAFILDASFALAWIFAAEATPYSEAVLRGLRRSGATAPVVWPLEVANALLMGERRGRIPAVETARAVRILRRLPITVDDGALA